MFKAILTNLRPRMRRLHPKMQRALVLCVSAICLGWTPAASATVAPVQISQIPMTVAVPAHPQIMLAVANSQSMDGTLSGAIMTGSGLLPVATAALQASSTPVNFSYTVGAGFSPPLNLGTVVCTPPPGCAPITSATPAGTLAQAPYTVNVGGQLLDNSPSRLNVAKAGITQILNTYMSSADFGLLDYSTSNQNPYITWVYQMSPVGGFIFTSTPGPGEYVANPCFGVSIAPATTTVQQDCAALNTRYATQSILTQPYMLVSASSDDPAINDVLYAPDGAVDPVCVVYGAVAPSSPFTGYTLGQYETDSVLETYPGATQGCGGARETGPTNAGFVPFSSEVMYEERGFGFYSGNEDSTANHTSPWSDISTALVPMTSAGAAPTALSVSNAVAVFSSFLAPESNLNNTAEIKATALQSPIAALIARAQQYFLSANPPSTNGCLAQRYVVLLTDGLPTMDRNGHAWPPLGSTSASPAPNGWSVSAVFSPVDGSLTSTNDQALSDVIAQLGLAYNGGTGNSIKTFIIGLGAGVEPSVNPTAAATLTAMAVAGGTGNASPVGYFAATSPTDVTNDLNIIITQILAATQSTASAAVNSTGLNTTSVVYQSQFDTSDTYQDWTGNLFAYPVLATGAVSAVPNWSLQTQLDGQTPASRIIATWDRGTSRGTPFEWNAAPPNGISASTMMGTQLMTFTPDTNGQDVLAYLRGDTSKEVRNGGKFRNRAHILGDIVDSSPLYVGAPSSPNQTPSYVTFAQAHAGRPPMVYVGANDGMLHAVDAATGTEKFAYVPRGGYSNLVNLASPFYNAQHVFFLNGSPQASDVQFSDNTWHTLLVGTERQGGKSIFAIDVTDPASISNEPTLANDVLWDVTDPDMGLGFSTPALANTADGWLVFVGNGYNSAQQKPFLYALDPKTGAIVEKIDLCAQVAAAICNTSVANGLSSVIAVNSSGQALGFANLLYAGDLQGNLWRIDSSSSNPANWTVTVLFQARDPVTSLPQSITTQPVASLNPQYPQTLGTMVFIVTGQLLGQPDLSTTQIQSVYGVFDPPAPSGTPLVRGTAPVLPAFVTSTGFITQTLSIPASDTAVVVDSSHTLNIPTNPGWLADLTLTTGERGVTDPRLESGGALVFTTYSPNFNDVTCKESGTGQLYVLNYATGGAFMSPQFDITGDGAVTAADMINMGGGVMSAPVGMSLGNVFAAAPTIRTANFLTASAVKLITLSDGTIKTVIEKGSSKSRTAWWEIRQ
jgi:type IV pilus assembly protein PilY1